MIIAIEIGGTKLQIAVVDTYQQKILRTARFVVNRSAGAEGILQSIEVTVKQMMASHHEVAAIVVGFGGPVNAATGEVATSHQIPGWSGFKLKQWLNDQFNLPAYIENDANLAALAETFFGTGKDFNPVLYITLGSGVGGGLTIDGELYKGNLPGEVEIGQIYLNADGTTLESVCSGWALDSIIRDAVKKSSGDTPLVTLTQNSMAHEAKFLYAAIEQNDSIAIDIFNTYIKNLCFGLSHAVHLFNPQLLILGGGVSLIGAPLQMAVQQQLPSMLAKVFQPGPVVALAETGETAVLLGALVLYQTEQKKISNKISI